MSFIWNDEQTEAIENIKKWFNNSNAERCYCLSGIAGSGKTTLAKHIAYDELNLDQDDVSFVSPTGKAANVLLSKGCMNSSTIHRLIYDFVEIFEMVELLGKKVKVEKKIFIKKAWLPLNLKLIICDEASMVSDKMINDLLSYGVKVLMLGDVYQLPPVGFKPNRFISDPDFRLEKVMRQNDGSSILDVAMLAKNGQQIQYGRHGDNVYVENLNSIDKSVFHDLLLKADQVICGRNKTQREVNTLIRQLKGIDTYENKLPLKGEKIICLNNSWDTFLDEDTCKYNLVNGSTGIAEDITILNDSQNIGGLTMHSDIVDEISENILFDINCFIKPQYKYEKKSAFVLPGNKAILEKFDKKERTHSELVKYLETVKHAVKLKQLNSFDFGYVISCHRMQGSESPNILLLDESYCFREDKFKWLYTGITRAKENLVILKGF